MDYGFKVPLSGPLATPEAIAELARRGEALGFRLIGVSDHIVIPKVIRSRYPYSESGEYGGSGECLDQLSVLGFLAGQTSTARLLTSIMWCRTGARWSPPKCSRPSTCCRAGGWSLAAASGG